ncbi:diguanylate cyclase [Aliiglaciecola sp. 2_MG-2023]|uniref:ligand-binding sensor domain-containing diguanylate cyclase n=1 Tax=unclassified Aliiglaciecola TaxID=2593648 RepID=UPI0026E3938A|nr:MULTISPECIES: ligand-binding sensor domain-containing diguanylate cyclase [unclassified Aliiglaciecola]MDO6712757.1 diguanylate cyclase [Aliiglaciecola sp. 2_MG-2023]MDO6753844.1 diguanylate cyclase [Aliiglaciecola sp. 1_MG-2023]
MHLWISLALFFGIVANAYSSSAKEALLSKRTLSTQDGLSQITVYDIEQDLDGYIWLATQKGIDRFDGYSFVNFAQTATTKNGLLSTRINDLELNHENGNLWLATTSGLHRFNNALGKMEDILLSSNPGEDYQRVTALHFDQNNDLWLEADSKLFTKANLSESFSEVNMPNSPAMLTIYEIVSDQQNILYFATNAGVFRLDTRSQKWLPTLLSDVLVWSVFIDSNQNLWVGTNGKGLFHYTFDANYEPVTKQHFSKEQGLSHNIVNDIEQTKSGEVWVATNSGLNIFSDVKNGQALTPIQTSNADSDSKSKINSLFIDASDQVLYGTLVSGFSVVSPQSLLFQRVAIDNNKVIFAAEVDNQGTLWATSPEGLWKIEANLSSTALVNFEKDDINEGTSNILLGTHYSAANDMLWIGTRVGLARLNDSKNGVSSVGLNGIPIYSIENDEQGNLYLGTVSNGMYHYNPNTFEIIHHYEADRVLGIHVSGPDKVWLATPKGLIKVNPLEKTQLNYKHDNNNPNSLPSDSLPGNYISWISSKSNNQYLVAVNSKGLFNMTEDETTGKLHFTELFPTSSLKDASIAAIVKDQQKNFWVSSIKGIAKIAADYSSLEFYDSTDGTAKGGYFIGGKSINSNGRIFFAGSDGLTHFHPDEIVRPKVNPRLNLTHIDILNEHLGSRKINTTNDPLSTLKDLSLALEDSDIVVTFEFAATELVAPEKIKYAHRLIGFNSLWQELKSNKRSITYTSLAAGHYVLEIKATNRYGEWLADHVAMDIEVSPPWYLSNVALILWIILALLSIYLYARWRSYSLYLRSQHLANEVTNKTRDLALANDKLRKLSDLDPLTNIFNRRGFTHAAKKQLAEYNESSNNSKNNANKVFSIVLFDIDFFKNINDTYGHDVGDEVLIGISQKIQNSLGVDDKLGRWGGEEFIALIHTDNIEIAFKIAERVRSQVADFTLNGTAEKIQITLSGGLAVVQADNNLTRCIKEADTLLFQAKENGRNQIAYKHTS